MRSIICIISLFLIATTGQCQETIFELFKSELRLADSYFENQDYHNALELYRHVEKRKPSRELELKIARAYHLLKQYDKAVRSMKNMLKAIVLPLRIFTIMLKHSLAFRTMDLRWNPFKITIPGFPTIHSS